MNDSTFQPLTTKTFRFRCHKDIRCFNECCADLKLVLTPYDILRMKNRLGMDSSEFLDQFTRTIYDKSSRFPRAYLKMKEDERKTCSFVTPGGCSIYEDRPGACRIYPLGRAALKVESEKNARERFFMVKEDHCLGFQENREWNIEEWMSAEGLDEYNAMNDQWLDILTSQKDLGPPDHVPKKIQMFAMASYNLDQFRNFIFKSRFFDLFEVSPDLKEKMAEDDVTLMTFAFDWLRFSLFGEKKLDLKK
ncbi:MAG: YkgJ family cysteine cluster protein [Deltaproteobacteria bacterium]|nr:YkgJ family cysteine cluster protein [Deltaproteobacteria bacterium]